MNQHPAIQKIETKHMRQNIPDFRPGDTLSVLIRVREGSRERIQTFAGIVIGKRNRGLNSSFILRRFSHGVGVERTFQTHSPMIERIEIKRRGAVRKAKLYYLRGLVGRKARIREKIGASLGNDNNVEQAISEQERVASEIASAAAEIANDDDTPEQQENDDSSDTKP